MAKVGVILSGCGVMDGSEILESVLTLLALDKEGAEVQCMAPDADQREVVNHVTNEKMDEKRNILVEAARITRGKIVDLKTVTSKDIDAVILPGGWGAVKNLCTFAYDSADCTVHPEVERLIKEMVQDKKPVGAMCIAPALLSRVLSEKPKAFAPALLSRVFSGKSRLKPKVTIGNDAGTAQKLEAMGTIHEECSVDQAVVDREHKIVTTPAYMLAERITDAERGISELVKGVMSLVESPVATS